MTVPSDVVVVDASLALKWVLDEPESGRALLLLAEWLGAGIQPIGPSWLPCELANVLFQSVRDGTFTLDEAIGLLSVSLEQIQLQSETREDAVRALQIASEAGQRQTYDAQYAALAERLGCELWTADDKFRDAVRGTLPGVRSINELT